MYCVIYSFTVKPDYQARFIKAWGDFTDLIYQYENSLGSRLHQVNDHEFIAYAQWPSKTVFDNAGQNMPPESDSFHQNMKQCCVSIETLYKMEMTDNKLKANPYNSGHKE